MKQWITTRGNWAGIWGAWMSLVISGLVVGTAFAQGDSRQATAAPKDCDALARRVMRGEVIARDAGVFAWYDLRDAQSGDALFLRQAVVGTGRKDRAEGVWLETEVVPRIGFPVLYKVLIDVSGEKAGRILEGQMREGYDPPQPLDVKNMDALPTGDLSDGQLEVVGTESVETPSGNIDACHVKVTRQDGKMIELWLAPDVTPTGIVHMRTDDGEMKLRFFGRGGVDGSSAMDRPPPFESNVTTKVTTQSGTAVEVAPPGSSPTPAPPESPDKARKNFNVRRNP